jgi:hypothetical protein
MLNEQEKIERYLDGEMSDSEKNIFEQEIKNNKELLAQVALSKDLRSFFKERNGDLDQTLTDLGNEYFKDVKPQNTTPNADTDKPIDNKARFIISLLCLLIVTIGGFWYFNSGSDSEKVEDVLFSPSTSVKETEKMINEGMEEQGDSDDDGSEAIPEIIEEATESPTKADNLPDDAPIKTKDKPKVDKPIAMVENKADFKENSALENLIRENVRSDKSITVKMPSENDTFARKNGIATLKFRFTTEEETPIELIIYNNQVNSFEKDYQILSTILRKTSNGEFTFNANVGLKNGLYYCILRKKESLEIIHVSKFFVR